jgi:hypothetical protein
MNKQLLNKIQENLLLPKTDELDELTNAAIRNQLLRNELPMGSINDNITTISNFLKITEDGFLDTDLRQVERQIKRNLLPTSQYFAKSGPKNNIFLHFTMGWNNPFNTITDWATDTRGKIGTQYVIGGINISTGDTQYDGVIVQAIPDEGYAWHIGIGDTEVHRNSIGIEICNFGYLTEKNGKFYTYTGREVNKKYVSALETPFRGYKYYHKLTVEQLKSLIYLIKLLAKKHSIDITKGIVSKLKVKKDNSAFDFDQNVVNGKLRGMHTHTNVSPKNKYGGYDKWDLAPTPELIDTLILL